STGRSPALPTVSGTGLYLTAVCLTGDYKLHHTGQTRQCWRPSGPQRDRNPVLSGHAAETPPGRVTATVRSAPASRCAGPGNGPVLRAAPPGEAVGAPGGGRPNRRGHPLPDRAPAPGHHCRSPRSCASAPPSTYTVCPVTAVLSGSARNRTVRTIWPTSIGPRVNGIGTCLLRASRPAGLAHSAAIIGVSTTPGPTAFNAIPCPAHASVGAVRRTQRARACLDAA